MINEKSFSGCKKKWLCIAVILTIIFISYTLVIKFVDVQTEGEITVGLGTINFWWRDLVGLSLVWNYISNVVAILVLFQVGLLLLWQFVILLRRKKIGQLAKHWWMFDVSLVILVSCYFLFEVLIINYRPIVINGVVDSSYPSSHVLLFCTVIPLVVRTVFRENKSWRWLSFVMCVGLLVLGVIARLLSGYHWLTDITGGVLLGIVINVWYQLFSYVI